MNLQLFSTPLASYYYATDFYYNFASLNVNWMHYTLTGPVNDRTRTLPHTATAVSSFQNYRIFSNLSAPFLQFQRAKKSDADYNRVRIRFAADSWILEK